MASRGSAGGGEGRVWGGCVIPLESARAHDVAGSEDGGAFRIDRGAISTKNDATGVPHLQENAPS